MAILEIDTRGAVAHLTMNAPERLNALSDEMIAALQATLEDIADNPKIRVIVIAGAGKGFCAGHDLRQLKAMRENADGGVVALKDLFDRCAAVMAQIRAMPQPVIAQVHGIATAAGCQLVATCDLAVAAEGTRFGVNGVNIGLFCSTPMVALSRNIARKKVFEMLTTGDFVDARRAEELGLINRVVPLDALERESMALAGQIAAKLGVAVKLGKSAFYRQIEMPIDQAYAFTGDVMVENMQHKDTQEGINAFLEKRPPVWPQ